MNKTFNIFSDVHLEPWDHSNPWTKGIGGSEVCHIELVERLAKRGHRVNSFSPLPPNIKALPNWKHFNEANPRSSGNWIVFRNPAFFDQKLNPKNEYIFVAQDVDYPWTPEQLKKVSKYVCLCQDHKVYTLNKYPQLGERVVVTSNGIRKEIIEQVEKENIPRNPNKIIYASSPDRGLELILSNWFRVIERVPSAELHIFYGFNNVETLAKRVGGWYATYPDKLGQMMNQPGVKFRGRLGQMELYREWFSSNIWWYPTNWPETSCITSLDAQSCGAIPVTNNYWAVGENVKHGYLTPSIPQDCALMKLKQIDYVCDLLKNPNIPWRTEMMTEARSTFDWENFVSDYESWGK